MKKRIAVKLAVFFIALICISSVLSFFASLIFTNTLSNDIKQSQDAIAAVVLELWNKTDLSLDEIIELTSSSVYQVRRIENPESIKVTRDELSRLQDNEIVYLTGAKSYSRAAMFLVDDSYLLIHLHPHNTLFKVVGSRLWFTLISFIAIGAVLIVLFVRKVVEPVVKLTGATKEVAKGNFDIQLEQQSEDEVGQLTRNFNMMIRELKSIEYLRKDFISNVSHELKTPIASIQGFAKLLQKGDLSAEEVREYTEIIDAEAGRLANLSSNMLKLSKIENQEILEKKEPFPLDEQIRKSVLLLEHKWNKKGIVFEIELDKVNYLGDEELLEQVWLNLLDNAIKFSFPKGRIWVSLRLRDGRVVFKIKDEGKGMSDAIRSRIFEKFYQGDQAHSREGSGLGLSLVKRILELHGGKITVKSKTKEGTTFTVELSLQG